MFDFLIKTNLCCESQFCDSLESDPFTKLTNQIQTSFLLNSIKLKVFTEHCPG